MSDKTEKPSAKKKRDERKKGNVAKSKEAVNVATFVGILFIFAGMSDFIIDELKGFLEMFLSMNMVGSLNEETVQPIMMKSMKTLFTAFLPIGLIIMVMGVIGNVMQTGFLLSPEAIKPKLDKLNPINGFKNMFSMRALGTLFKSLAIIVFLGCIGVSFVKSNYYSIVNVGNTYTPYLMSSIKYLIVNLLKVILIGLVVIGALDYAYQLFSYDKQMRMTKQEVKEEFKQMEGDPLVKAQIKQRQRQMASQRMMDAVPTATVILTNPTHLSIALRYEKGVDSAPVVVAKGADLVAMKIREIAKEHDIPIIENKPLARLMFKEVEINEEIPVEMYQTVAEVLTQVYKIKKKKKYF